MKIPKRYGESRVDRCPFCDEQATAVNTQGVPVCRNHTKKELGEMRCVCGDALDIKQGKYGVFFSCMNCGAMNMRKALEINQPARPGANYKVKQRTSEKKEKSAKNAESSPGASTKENSTGKGYKRPISMGEDELIRSDDPRYFD